jgi:2,5-diketo-D-gluconate reductase A
VTEVTTPPTVTIGAIALPVVGLGTWQLTGDEGYRAVRVALDAGYRHLDTATQYGNHREVGHAIRESGVPRGEIAVTTKIPPSHVGRERATIEESLRELGLDYVDLWLIHWPPAGQAYPSTWQELLRARDDGLTRAAGVSNYSPDQLDELASATGEMPPINQIPWSPTRHDENLLAAHRERGVVVEGYSPFRHTDLQNPALVRIAESHGIDVGQAILRWHLQHQIVVIPKSATPSRIATNLDLFGFELTTEEMTTIDALSRR